MQEPERFLQLQLSHIRQSIWRRCKKIADNQSLQDFGFSKEGDSVDFAPRAILKDILGKPFNVVEVRHTPTKKGKWPNPDALTIKTVESFIVEGEEYHDFLVSWKVTIDQLNDEKFRKALESGPQGPLKLISQAKKDGSGDFYKIVIA